jgi:S-DNA-T family DNA segregation ATPase FtsK/SpoIIIE
VAWADLPPPSPGRAWLGRGGDTAEPLAVPLAPGRMVGVIGPPGSGKTAALAVIAAGARAAGSDPVTVDGREPDAWPRILDALGAGGVVLADDLAPSPACPPALPATGVLVAAMSTAAAAAYVGPGALLRARPTAIVLWPEAPGSAEAVGERLTEVLDPMAPRRPGRAALIADGRAAPLQIAAPPIPSGPLCETPENLPLGFEVG